MATANASKTAIVTMALLLGGCHQLMAQGDADSVSLRPSFGLDYTSELQTNFSRVKWVNLLELSAEVPLSRKFYPKFVTQLFGCIDISSYLCVENQKKRL